MQIVDINIIISDKVFCSRIFGNTEIIPIKTDITIFNIGTKLLAESYPKIINDGVIKLKKVKTKKKSLILYILSLTK